MKETTITIANAVTIKQGVEDAMLSVKLQKVAQVKAWITPLVKILTSWSVANLRGAEIKDITEIKITPSQENIAVVSVKFQVNLEEVPIKMEIPFAAFSHTICPEPEPYSHNYFMIEIYGIAKELCEKVEENLPVLLGMDKAQIKMDF